MHVAVRVDASGEIGTGHFMRCLTLSDVLQQRGMKVRFICRHLPEHFRHILADKGIELTLLCNSVNTRITDNLMHSHWLGVSQQQDAEESIQALSDKLWDWLIVDHYALDSRWESELRQVSRKLFVIDDIADREHNCDILLDQNFYPDRGDRYKGKVPPHCQLLLGPRYALLRSEFYKLRESVGPRMGAVKRVLIFFGGVDADNYTGQAINALASIEATELDVDVVVGAQHPRLSEIESACLKNKFFCHIQTSHMAKLMAKADLAIGAGGSSIWERCCLGLPALSICVAENQYKQIIDAATEGLLYAPMVESDLFMTIKNHVGALIENNALRQLISQKCMQTVDGRGVLRIVGHLRCSGIEVREVNVGDSRKLFEWRNHSSIRMVSLCADPIPWDVHQKWLSSVMEDKDRVLLLGLINGEPVGVVRFDRQENVAEVSIYLVPDSDNSGFGGNLLMSAEQWVLSNQFEVTHIRAKVLDSNQPSNRLFSEAGYKKESISYLKGIC